MFDYCRQRQQQQQQFEQKVLALLSELHSGQEELKASQVMLNKHLDRLLVNTSVAEPIAHPFEGEEAKENSPNSPPFVPGGGGMDEVPAHEEEILAPRRTSVTAGAAGAKSAGEEQVADLQQPCQRQSPNYNPAKSTTRLLPQADWQQPCQGQAERGTSSVGTACSAQLASGAIRADVASGGHPSPQLEEHHHHHHRPETSRNVAGNDFLC